MVNEIFMGKLIICEYVSGRYMYMCVITHEHMHALEVRRYEMSQFISLSLIYQKQGIPLNMELAIFSCAEDQ